MMAATLMQRDDDDDDQSDFPGPTSTIKGLTGTRFGNRKESKVLPMTLSEKVIEHIQKDNNGLNKSGTVLFAQPSKKKVVRAMTFERVRLPSQDAELEHRVPDTTVIPETVVVRKKILPRFMFTQVHTARWIWDFVVIGALLWVTTFTPLQIAFSYEDCGAAAMCPATKLFASTGFIAAEVLIDLIFWADIAISFRTSYREENGTEVFDAELIARRYLKEYFTIDLLSCIPGYPLAAIDLLLNQPCSDDGSTSGNLGGFIQLIKFSKTSKLLKMARIVKLIRLGKVLNLLRKIEERFVMVRLTAFKLISILGITFIMAHVIGCMFLFFAAVDDANYYTNSWVYSAGLHESGNTCMDTYITALYWAFTTMTTVGYGDVNPVSNLEKAFAMFAMMVGCITYSFIIVSISNLMRFSLNDSVFQRRMEEIKSYMTVRKVPAQLRLEIQDYFKYYYKKRTALGEATILDMLTPQLKDKMRNFLVRDTLDTIGFFKTLDNNAITLLLAVLKPFKVDAGKILIAAGESGSEMFFLVEGQMDVYSAEGNNRRTIHAVTSFGEVAMMGLEPARTATVVARTDCELLCLDHKDMLVVFRHYPEVMEHIIEGARQKYEKLKLTDQDAFAPKRSEPRKRWRRISVAFNSPHHAGLFSSSKPKFSSSKPKFSSSKSIFSSSKPKFSDAKESQDGDNRVIELLKQLESRLGRKQQEHSQEILKQLQSHLDRKLQVHSQEVRSTIEDIKTPILKQLQSHLDRKLQKYSQKLLSAIEDIKQPQIPRK